MSILIGHASISEKGTINGTKGDQTKEEVCIREWYKKKNKSWDFMAIHPDANVREKHAKAVEAGCANDNIGYGQSDRNTLNTEAKEVNYDLSKVGKCNTDCSEFQNVCAVASGAPGVTHASNGWTTSTMKEKLSAAGYKIITDKTYLDSAEYCVRGAIYVISGSHTICGLSNGSKAAQTLAKAGISGSTKSEQNTSYVGKGIGTATAKTTMNIRSGAGTHYNKYGKIATGTSVEVLEILSGWYKIVWTSASCGYAFTSCEESSYYSYTAKNTSASTVSKPQTSISKPSYMVGKTYTVVASDLKVRTGAGTNYAAKKHSQLTTDGQKHDKDNDGALDRGTKVTCKEVKNVGNDIWIRTPSGWLAAYYNGEVYVK